MFDRFLSIIFLFITEHSVNAKLLVVDKLLADDKLWVVNENHSQVAIFFQDQMKSNLVSES